jgi:TPR repeat protein
MDTAEHMFAKSKQLSSEMNSSTAESLADLMYEMGRDMLRKRHYELAVRWLERAYDVLGEQDIEVLGPEAGELRLGIMQTIGLLPYHAY